METNETASITSVSFMSCVRFTESEYRQLQKAQILTGKSIPWLLKTAFFNHGVSAPTLDNETRKTVRTELSRISNNLNQIAKHVHSGLISEIKSEFEEVLQAVRCLKSFLKLGFGEQTRPNQ